MKHRALVSFIFFFLIQIILLSLPVSAQKKGELPYSKWGVVSPEDIALTSCPFDPDAPAMILHDVGTTHIDDNDRAYEVRHSRFRRIKVFKLEDFKQDMLNIEWASGRDGETIVSLDVQHIPPDGIAEKISSDNIFSEKVNQYFKVKKIFVPNLKAGSIVEYRYEIVSPYVFSLYDWFFHNDLPVRWSELTTRTLPYFDYHMLSRIYKEFDLQEAAPLHDGSYKIRVGMAEVPSMKAEPYMTSVNRYRSHVRFQLSATQFPGRGKEQIMTTWQKSALELEMHPSFGKQYEKGGNFKAAWQAFAPLLQAGESPEAVAEKALSFVQKNVLWTGYNGILTEKDLDDAFKRRQGSTPEVNLLLVGLLQKADLDAVPVLVSTRNHGTTYEKYPFLQQFNSVVALLRVGDKKIFLDATQPYLPLNQLAKQHISGRGWIVDRKAADWTDLPTPEMGINWLVDGVLGADGSISGHFKMSGSGLIATQWRTELDQVSPQAFVKEKFASQHTDLQLDSVQTEEGTGNKKSVIVSFKYHFPGTAAGTEHLLYCSPVFDFFVRENPFKSVRRDYPVNFYGPVRANYVIRLTLPEGFVPEELPAASRLGLPNQTGSISFACQKEDEQHLQLSLRMTLINAEYGPEYYDYLRKFFDIVAEKVNTKLVLKKN